MNLVCVCVCSRFPKPPKVPGSWNFGSRPNLGQLRSLRSPIFKIFIFTDSRGLFHVFSNGCAPQACRGETASIIYTSTCVCAAARLWLTDNFRSSTFVIKHVSFQHFRDRKCDNLKDLEWICHEPRPIKNGWNK